MKHSVLGFNQEKACSISKEIVVDGAPRVCRLDISDLIILQEISELPNKNGIVKFIFGNDTYYSLTYNEIVSDYPILCLKKQSVRDRIDKLCALGLVDRKVVNNERGSWCVFKVGSEYESLMFSENQTVDFGIDSMKNAQYQGKIKEDDEFVERMYQMYPSKCPMRGTSLGKCSKDKERIRKLLKSYSKEDIEKVFKMEIGNKYGKSYMQNFSTFLNNFPDPKEISEDTAPLQPQKPQQQQPVHRDPNSAEELDEYYKILKQRNIENEEAYERSLAEQRKSEILRYIEERKDDVCILGVGETFQNDYFDLTGLEDGTIKWVCRVANCQRRFYFNRHDDVMISIPLDAPPMPDKMSVYDFESKGWR